MFLRISRISFSFKETFHASSSFFLPEKFLSISFKKNSICFAVIEPHGLEMVEAAKKIRIEFLKMHEDITRKINLDDFIRVLPSGKSQIKEVSVGDLDIKKFTDTELD